LLSAFLGKCKPWGGPDQWVQAFQGADLHRKSKGAYATPTSFADAIAEATLNPLRHRARLRIVDPSAGAGAFLVAAIKALRRSATAMELDPLSRELCCLLIWIDAASARPSLKIISQHIIVANAIKYDWWSNQRGPFDALLMNPPWESLRHQASSSDPHYTERQATIARLSEEQKISDDLPPLFSAQGRGDRNLFKAFVELAPHLIRDGGRLGALIPAAFASDLGMAPLRALYFDHFSLERWTSFENLRRYFPIDSRYKFGIMIGTRSPRGTSSIAIRSFATEPSELAATHVNIDRPMIAKLGGSARMLPELTDAEEARVLERMSATGRLFFEPDAFGHRALYRRELDLTLDKAAKKFHRFENMPKLRRMKDGSFHSGDAGDGRTFVPLVEGRMVGRYDIFQKSWVHGEGRRAKWELNRERKLRECTPQYVVEPTAERNFRVAICDVTSATNTRTVHAALVPPHWICGNTAPVLQFETATAALSSLAGLNSLVFDWMARRVVGGLHLNKFYLATLVWPNLDAKSANQLANMAAAMLTKVPRQPSWITDWIGRELIQYDDMSRTDIEVEIEREIAKAFNLDVDMLQRVLSPDRSDRRGFWRYFAANPSVFLAVRNMLRKLETEPMSTIVAAWIQHPVWMTGKAHGTSRCYDANMPNSRVRPRPSTNTLISFQPRRPPTATPQPANPYSLFRASRTWLRVPPEL
jgi:N-6 DNA Methylase